MVDNHIPAYKLQMNDLLYVKILTTDDKTYEDFNIQPKQGQQNNNEGGLYLNSVTVDAEGYVAMPVIGKVEAMGKTISELKTNIGVALEKYLTDATVIVKMVNFKVAVLGEVSRPGYFNIYKEQINIFEVLSMAGDLTEYANRKKIKLIRQKGEKTEVTPIDLTKSEVLESDRYYLLPNDIIYIEPLRARTRRANLPLLSTLFSGVSTIVLLLNFVNK